jgi:hypothetical protein
MLALVDRLMRLLLAGEDSLSIALRAQYEQSSVRELKLTGVGFFADFDVREGVAPVTPRSISAGDAKIELAGVEHGAGCVLFVRDGFLSFLEGYVYSGEWPERPGIVSISSVVTIAKAEGIGSAQ